MSELVLILGLLIMVAICTHAPAQITVFLILALCMIAGIWAYGRSDPK